MRLRSISKLVLTTLLAISLMALSIPAFASPTPTFKLFVDGVHVKTDASTKLSGNQLVMPLKTAASLIGAVSGSGSKAGTTYIRLDDMILSLTLNSKDASMNGKKYPLGLAIAGTAAAPVGQLKDIVEAFGGHFSFEQKGKDRFYRVTLPGSTVFIRNVAGTVEVQNPAVKPLKWTKASSGAAVFANWKVRTAADAARKKNSVELVTSDGTSLKLGGGTEVLVRTLTQDKKTRARNVLYEVVKGEVWSNVAKQTKGSKFVVQKGKRIFTAHGTQFYIGEKSASVLSGVVTVVDGAQKVALQSSTKVILPTVNKTRSSLGDSSTLVPTLMGENNNDEWDIQKPWVDKNLEDQDGRVANSLDAMTNMLSDVPATENNLLDTTVDELKFQTDKALAQQFEQRQAVPSLDLAIDPTVTQKLVEEQKQVQTLLTSGDPDLKKVLTNAESDAILDLQQGLLSQLRGNIDLFKDLKIPGLTDIEKILQFVTSVEGELPVDAELPADLLPQLRIPEGFKIPNINIPQGIQLPEGFVMPQGLDLSAILNNLPKDTMLPLGLDIKSITNALSSKNGLPEGIVLPTDINLSEILNFKLPEGVVLPPGIQIPKGFKLPEGVILPKNIEFASGFELPPGIELPPGFEIPKDIKLPAGFEIPADANFQFGFQMPKGVNLPEGFEIPEGMKFESGFELPQGIQLPPGFEIPSNIKLPEGFQIPSGITIQPGTQLPDGVKLPDGFKLPDGVKLPDGFTIPDGVKLPDGFTLPSGGGNGSMMPTP